ncbi:UNVERIFIED_CONTAM: hypothetical protein K2H54_075135 [Gekko kuhli]
MMPSSARRREADCRIDINQHREHWTMCRRQYRGLGAILDALEMLPPWYQTELQYDLQLHREHSQSPSLDRGDLVIGSRPLCSQPTSEREALDLGSDEPLVPSPDDRIERHQSTSPSEDLSTFSDLLMRMAKALDLKHTAASPKTKDDASIVFPECRTSHSSPTTGSARGSALSVGPSGVDVSIC